MESALDKNIYVGVYQASFSLMSRSKGLSVLRGVTQRGCKNLWTPFVPPGWSSECFDRLFWALGFEDWHGSSETLYEWRGMDSELVAINPRLECDYKMAAIRAHPDDFDAVWQAITLLMADCVQYEFSVTLCDGVENSQRFSDLIIISEREPPPPGLEELRPIAQRVGRLLEKAATTVFAKVRERQQPALAAIRRRIDRF
jgi:hypothetical protein